MVLIVLKSSGQLLCRMWDFFKKIFIIFVTILLLLYVLVFFDQEACGILAPQPTPPALEGEILTTEPPGTSQLLVKCLQAWISVSLLDSVKCF